MIHPWEYVSKIHEIYDPFTQKNSHSKRVHISKWADTETHKKGQSLNNKI